ncbi:Lrp/AsnC family transcriptional regulator, partial [Treponema endosymbiont of Eucomonympha sp.]|uniref:Lrp/AsnC family transcriptional regulator n=1 Tax=Treponema endosymbiont of Eucomonympha sp. TaxID=1580831 RepID=UPI001E5FF0F3
MQSKLGRYSFPRKGNEYRRCLSAARRAMLAVMDEILELLQDNARLSVADIAAMTQKDAREVEAAIRRLEDGGVILKYAAIVDPAKAGAKQAAVRAEIEIQVTPERERGFDA